ncbi:MAG: MFS transporter [Firmicutes bacterium]|jgi:fucose permease|nr:MFS transporter [Bacillota bacterium]MDH7496798.1 MFS transporter [Bacillota bacterium]
MGWGLGALCAAGFVIFGMTNTMTGPLLPSLRLDYQLSLSRAGSLFTVQFAGFILSVLVGGVLADTFGKRKFVVATTAILICGLTLIGCFRNVWLLDLGFFAMGVGFGGFDAGLAPLVGDLNAHRRAFALNLLHTFFGVGALVGPLWAGYIVAGSVTWRYAYLAMAACSLVFLLAFGARRIAPRLGAPRPAGEKPSRERLSSLAFDRRLMLLAGLVCVYVGVESGVSAWVFSFLTAALRATREVATGAVSLFWASLTLGRLVSAYVSERLGHSSFIACCCAGSVLAGLPLMMGPGVGAALASCVALGFFFSGIFPTIMAQGTSLFPGSTGSVTGMLVAAGAAGGAVFPWLIGLVSDAFSLSTGMLLIPVGCGLMLALSVVNALSTSARAARRTEVCSRDRESSTPIT